MHAYHHHSPLYTPLVLSSQLIDLAMAEKQKDETEPRAARASWRPFEKIKSILSKKTRSRSNSPDHSPVIFTAGQILHAHTSPATFEDPQKYILVSISNKGTLLPLDKTSTNLIGFLVCECSPEIQYTTQPKNIVFIPQPQAGFGHFISSPFVMPELSSAQKLVTKSYPLFYRLPQKYAYLKPGESLKDIDTEQISSDLIGELSTLTEFVESNNVQNVYQKLFSIGIDVTPSVSSASSPPPQEAFEPPQTGHPPEQVYDILHFETTTDTPPNEPLVPQITQMQLNPFQPNSSHLADDSHTPRRLSLGVLVYKQPCLDFWGIPKQHRLPKDVALIINRGVRKQISSDLVGLFICADHPTSRIEFYEVSNRMLSTIQLIYTSSRYQGIVYTVAPNQQIRSHLQAFMSLSYSQAHDWYSSVYKSILNRSIFPSCPTCNATFPDERECHLHQKSTHSSKSAKFQSKRNSTKKPTNLPLLSSDSEEDEASSVVSESHRQTRHNGSYIPEPQPSGILQKQIYRPDILDQIDCPNAYKIFWDLRAYSRPYTKADQTYPKWVAPKFPSTMLELESHVNYKGLLSDEFISYAKAYQSLAAQRDFSSVDQSTQLNVGVFNDAHSLTILGKGKVLEDLRRQAPQLGTKTLASLTEASLQSFFFQARTYMLSSSIPWDSFPEYFLTTTALGADILTKTQEALQGYPTYKKVLRTLSAFIERILRTLLPAQESYYDSESRIIEEHRSHLLGPHPNVDYTRTKLQSDSRELVTKSPHYVQCQTQISDENKRLMIEAQKANLLSKILANTAYEAKLYKLLIASDSYKTIETVPYNVLLDHMQNLIIAEQKSQKALVHASKTRERSMLRSPARRSTSLNRSPPPPHRQRSNSRSSRPSSPTRSRGRSPALQSKCDLCSKLDYPKNFCRQGNHCRVDGHQPTFKDSMTFKKKVDNNEKDLFAIYNRCRKCNVFKAPEANSPRPMQWVQHGQHGNATSSPVTVPNNYFQQPYQLHPMSAVDISRSVMTPHRMPPPPHQYPYAAPPYQYQYPPVPAQSQPFHHGPPPSKHPDSQSTSQGQRSRSPYKDQFAPNQQQRKSFDRPR